MAENISSVLSRNTKLSTMLITRKTVDVQNTELLTGRPKSDFPMLLTIFVMVSFFSIKNKCPCLHLTAYGSVCFPLNLPKRHGPIPVQAKGGYIPRRCQ